MLYFSKHMSLQLLAEMKLRYGIGVDKDFSTRLNRISRASKQDDEGLQEIR